MTAAQLCILCVGQYRSCIWYHDEAQRPGGLSFTSLRNCNSIYSIPLGRSCLGQTPQIPSRKGGLLSDCLFSRGADGSKPFDNTKRKERTVPACPSRGKELPPLCVIHLLHAVKQQGAVSFPTGARNWKQLFQD